MFKFGLPEYRGLVPDLRLLYNSSRQIRGGPDNIVAYGWRLGGLSRIERVSLGGGVPTYDDGQDLYRLDGEDLMACNDAAATQKWTRKYPLRFLTDNASASCSAGGNLSKRVESGLKIRYMQSNNEFLVTRPNGVQYRYQSVGALAGDTSTSGQQYQMAHQNRWVLTEIRDTQKNSGTPTNVVYLQYIIGAIADGYPERVSAIVYGGYRVTFGYKAWDRPSYFGTGTTTLGQQRYRLGSIAIHNGGNKIRAYGIDTISSARNSTTLLHKVRSYGDNFEVSGGDITSGAQLPETSFEYSPETFSFTERTYPNTQFHHANPIADLDYNGSEELVFVARRMEFDGPGDQTTYQDLYAGSYRINSDRSIATIPAVSLPCGKVNNVLGQFDNVRSAGSDRSKNSVQTCASISYGHLTFPNTESAHLDEYEIGTGNQLPISSNSIKTYPRGDTPNLPLVYIQSNLSPISEYWSSTSQSNALIGDWTGDGVTDFRYIDAIRSYLPEAGFLDGVSHSAGYTWSRSATLPFPATPEGLKTIGSVYPSIIGDFNGDGLDDVAHGETVFASTGLGFVNIQLPAPTQEDVFRPNITQTADINSDGLDDIIIHAGFADLYSATLPFSLTSTIHLNTGFGFTKLSVSGSSNIAGLVGVGDFDGDGLTDLLIGGSPGKILFGQGDIPNLLTAINGGFGERTEIAYGPSTQFGYNQAPRIQQVVTQIKVRDGRGGGGRSAFWTMRIARGGTPSTTVHRLALKRFPRNCQPFRERQPVLGL